MNSKIDKKLLEVILSYYDINNGIQNNPYYQKTFTNVCILEGVLLDSLTEEQIDLFNKYEEEKNDLIAVERDYDRLMSFQKAFMIINIAKDPEKALREMYP